MWKPNKGAAARWCFSPRAPDRREENKELRVLKLMAKGCSGKVARDRLEISEDTAKRHVRNILEKLSANARTHAVTIRVHRGWFEI
jgi:DNA-binding NarL/FixJ family response regulator